MNKLKNKNRKSIKSRKSKKSLNKNRVRPSRKTRKTIKTRKTRKTRKSRKARKTGGSLKLKFKDNSGIEHLYTSNERNLNPYKKAEPSVVRINDYVCIKDSALEDMNNLLYELFIRRFKDSTNTRNLHRAKSLSLTDFFKSSNN